MHVAHYGWFGNWGFCGLKGALMWEKEEGQGAESYFPQNLSPLSWAQGLPPTSPHEPWSPTPSSSNGLGPLDKLVTTVFLEDWNFSKTTMKLAPCRWCFTLCPAVTERGKSIQTSHLQKRKTQLACTRSPCIPDLLTDKCFRDFSSPVLPLKCGEVPSLLDRAQRRRGGESLASFGLWCQHNMRSPLEATERGPWCLGVEICSVGGALLLCSLV